MGRFDEYLDDAPDTSEKPEPAPRTVPPRDKAALAAKIERGILPQKSWAQRALESVRESNTVAGQNLMDQTLFGAPGRVARALGVYGPEQPQQTPGKTKRWEDYLPNEEQLTSVPAAALDTVAMGGAFSKAGETLGRVPQALARKAGISEASTAIRPAIQTVENAAASGALYGGSNEAIRGGNAGDIGSGMLMGAGGNALMSHAPAALSSLEDAGVNAMARRAAKPLLGIGQGQRANKSLKGLGHGDAEVGKEELKKIVKDENLAPAVNGKTSKLQQAFDDRLQSVWDKELGPIRDTALRTEPNAKIQVSKIEEKLRGTLQPEQLGTDAHEDVEKAIALLKERAAKAGGKGQFPIRNLLKNAQEFERDGFGKTEAKFADGETARAIGRALRELVDDRIWTIYKKNPNAAREALGRPEKKPELGEAHRDPRLAKFYERNRDLVPPEKPFPSLEEPAPQLPQYDPMLARFYDRNWDLRTKPELPRPAFGEPRPESWKGMSDENALNMEVLGQRYLAARQRYANLKRLEPLIDQLAMRHSQERPGFVATLKHLGGSSLAGMMGFGVAGHHGVIPAIAASEAIRVGTPYAERAAAALGRAGAGNPVDPGVSGAIIGEKGDNR